MKKGVTVATVSEIVREMGGKVLNEGDLTEEISGCYVSDLLSDVLANSQGGNLWITQHTHPNVVAVAAVKELAGVIMVGGKPIEPETIERARAENVTVVSSGLSAFETAGFVYNLLNPAKKD